MAYDLIQGQGPKVATMADFKVCWYACNQKNNDELWYSKMVAKFCLDRFLIFILVWHHLTVKL